MGFVKTGPPQVTKLSFQVIVAAFFFFSCLTFFFRFAKMIHVHLEVKKAVHHLLVVTDTQGNPGGNTPLSFIKYGGSRGHREAGLAPGLWGSQEGLM